jgi:hypothetical protein
MDRILLVARTFREGGSPEQGNWYMKKLSNRETEYTERQNKFHQNIWGCKHKKHI